MLLQNEIILKVNALCSVPGKVLQDFRGFSLGLDDMEGDLSPPYVQGDKAVIGGTDGEGHILYGGGGGEPINGKYKR